MTKSVRIKQAPNHDILRSNSSSSRSHNSIIMNRQANGGMGTIGTKPTLLEVGPKLRFLIMDAPRQGNLHLYIKEMRKHSVTDLVRVCEPTYQTGELQNAGIAAHNMEYPDGHSPPRDAIDEWLKIVDKAIYGASEMEARPCVAVHCVAGLGRAPVMVAIALIEFDSMDPVDAVTLIRRHRRGAINEKQLLYLEGYKKSYKSSGGEGGCCVIS
uniref:protein-tyrosine-phosphatase n=1 Tax=Pseudo-nitzschia delicatissima TaxID=44447 RepID=A0A7S0UHY2_9STRA|mmetsp:Transcript_1875/g.3921  ORF Transcript_1875/g.3921 Transcript_1875/m.3921 type:complete len:213 (+) Transcript_1875:486-1124(+)